MNLTPEQCRAARGLLNWQQNDLAVGAGVSQKSISDFEKGQSTPWSATLERLRHALEVAGVEFLAPIEGISGGGVRLKWGVTVQARPGSDGEEDETGRPGKHSLAPDSELAAYWEGHPERWATLSESGKRVLTDMMFGSSVTVDESFGNDAR